MRSKKPSTNISLYYQNAGGINTKISDIYLNTLDEHYEIILLTETWLQNNIFNAELFNKNYAVIRKDRKLNETNKKTGGGVFIALNKNINYLEKSLDDVDPKIDYLFVEVFLASGKVFIILVYVPPSTSVDAYTSLFNSIENISNISGKTVIMMGDFNVPKYFPDCETAPTTTVSETEHFMSFLNLKQCNYVRNAKNYTLDLVFSNSGRCAISQDPSPITKECTHHPALSIEIDISGDVSCPFRNVERLNFGKADFVKLYALINSENWSMDDNLSIDTNVSNFYNKLHNIIIECVPKKITCTKYPVWFTKSISSKIKLKEKLRKKISKSSNLKLRSHFQSLRSTIKTEIKLAYNKYQKTVNLALNMTRNNFGTTLGQRN